MNVLRKLRTFGFILRHRPAQAWELLQIRTERSLGVPLFFLSLRRLATYVFEAMNTLPVSGDLAEYGNYRLSTSRLGSQPVVFSVGIGKELSFDLAILERHDARLFLFDPTPTSKIHVEGLNLPPNAQFCPVAVTDRDGTVELFIDDLESDFQAASSVSIFNRGFGDKGFTVDCRRIKTLMAERGLTHLDVLKMDIEGAAIIALRDVLRDGIRPTQIACEFERPEGIRETYSFLRDIAALFDDLKKAGYTIYRTRELDKGCQIEVVAVRSPNAPAETPIEPTRGSPRATTSTATA